MAKSILSIILKTVKEGGADKETIFALKELQKNIGTATAVAGAMATAYAAVDQVLGESVRATVAYANEVRNMIQLTGQSAEEASKVIQVMDDFKVSTEALTMATKTLAKQGLTLNINTLSKLSDEYNRLGTGAEKTAFLVEKFGKSGLSMAEAMQQGGDALRQMSDEVDKSLVLNTQALENARQYERAIDDLNDSWEAVKVTIGNAVIPALLDLISTEKQVQNATEAMNNARRTGGVIIANSAEAAQTLREAHEKQKNAADSATLSYIAMGKSMQEVGKDTIELENNFKSLLDMTMSLAGASDEATAKIVYNNLLQKLSVDGITDAEFAMAQQAGVALGIFDQSTANSALAIDKLTTAVQQGKLDVDNLGTAIANLPGSKNIDLLINLGGNGAAYLNAQNIKPVIKDGEVVVPYRDSGGPGVAGKPYIISPSAGPEMFIPSSNGTFVPNVDEVLGGSSQTIVVNYYHQPVMSLSAQADATNAARPIVEEIVRRMR